MNQEMENDVRIFLSETICGLNGYLPRQDFEHGVLKKINDALITLINHPLTSAIHADGEKWCNNCGIYREKNTNCCDHCGAELRRR